MADKDKEQEVNEDIFNALLSSRYMVESSRELLFIWFPTINDRMASKYFYEKFMRENKGGDILSIEDAMKMHKKQGLWSDKKEDQLIKLPKFIEETEIEISRTKQETKIKSLKKWKTTLEKFYIELLSAKNTIFANTLEYLANDTTNAYLTYRCVHDLYDKPLWDSFEDMLASNETSYIQEICMLFNSKTLPIKESDLRIIARAPVWRVRWNTSKEDISSLFGRGIKDISNDQFMLVYWSQVYDMAYESLERPPDEVIDDDIKFNKWLEDTIKNHKVEVSQRYYSKGVKEDKYNPAGEILRMVNGYYDEDGIFHRYSEEERINQIQSVQKANTSAVKNKLAREEKVLESNFGKMMLEEDLRRPRPKIKE